MALFFQGIASLFTAECACVSLIFTSLIDDPSSVCADPRYLNWSTYSSIFPFIHKTMVDGLGQMLLSRILLLSELISML